MDRRRPAPVGMAALQAVPARDVDPANLKDPALYINRELSWLEFNGRVLSQALDATHPLLERVKFLAITAANLDEFFMIRISTTLKKLREGVEDVAPDGYNTAQQLDAMRTRARRLGRDQVGAWKELRQMLASDEPAALRRPVSDEESSARLATSSE